MAGVLNKLKDVLEDGEPRLQRLSMKIVYHLALEKAARDSIGKTEGILQSLSNLSQSNDKEDIMPEMVLKRLLSQNKANFESLLPLEDTNEEPIVMEEFLDGELGDKAKIMDEQLDASTKDRDGATTGQGGLPSTESFM